MKNWYKSKTIWVAVLTGVMGVVIAFQSEFPTVGWIVITKSGLDIVLRFLTKEGIE